MDFIINDFEGPLDLLLHLIKESKMDIMNIEIEKIVNQYMDFLDKQEKMNLEVSSEYLVLASELIEIKSKLLLPNNKVENEDEEIDPREELVNRLLEYQAYKDITKVLQSKELMRKDIYTKVPENINNYIDENHEICADITLDDLVNALERYYKSNKSSIPIYSITFGDSSEYELNKVARLTNGKVFDGKSGLKEAFMEVRSYN